MARRNSTELKSKMSGRWLSALCELAPCLTDAAKNIGQNVVCPMTGSDDGFRLFRDANETGGGCKQSYKVFPEGIELLMWINDWSFTKAFDELEAWLGEKPVNVGRITIPIAKPKPIDEKWLRIWLNKMWDEALPLDHVSAFPARTYFRRRGMLDASLNAKDVRFHPQMEYKNKQKKVLGTFGAVLLKVRNNEGLPVSIHRTFITTSGIKVNLGEGNKPKKMTPSLMQRSKGRHVRLFAPIDGILGVTEGLETALAVYQARRFPVWPGISTGMLQGFEPPKGVHTLINFVDKDRNKAGENTHEILKSNLLEKGIRVIDLLPPMSIPADSKGVDWADQLLRDPQGFYLLDEYLNREYLKQA